MLKCKYIEVLLGCLKILYLVVLWILVYYKKYVFSGMKVIKILYNC